MKTAAKLPKGNRFGETLEYFTSGYSADLGEILKPRTSKVRSQIVFKNIGFASLCEHHLLPFYGEITIAYVPAGKILSPGRPALLVDALSRRLQLQEKLANQLADEMQKRLKPAGVAVLVDATHFCTLVRTGRTARMQATEYRGAYSRRPELRRQFLAVAARGATR